VPLSHLSVYQISRELHNLFVFYKNFHTLTKRRKKRKNEETKPIFEGLYLGNAQCDLVELWNVRWCHWLAFLLQKSFGFVKVSQSYLYRKIALLFFLLITHGCGAPAFWAAWHTTMCLEILKYKYFKYCTKHLYLSYEQVKSTCMHAWESSMHSWKCHWKKTLYAVFCKYIKINDVFVQLAKLC